MADVGDNNYFFMRYVYRGEEDESIPWGATHIIVGEDVTFVRARAFEFRNIVEVICHENVERIERYAFSFCPNLRRVIMPGVKIVERWVFEDCKALTDVECSKLEIIEQEAFSDCVSLRSIDLPSARVFGEYAFDGCKALTSVKFGSMLERLNKRAFGVCTSLERITIPLKSLIAAADTFMACDNLKHVDLTDEGAELHEFVTALQLEEWRNDMNEEIDSINQVLPNTSAGQYDISDPIFESDDPGEKAQVIRTWIRSVLGKVGHYEEEHERLLREGVEPTLQLVLPHDIVMSNVLPFLKLSSHWS